MPLYIGVLQLLFLHPHDYLRDIPGSRTLGVRHTPPGQMSWLDDALASHLPKQDNIVASDGLLCSIEPPRVIKRSQEHVSVCGYHLLGFSPQ